MHHPQPYQAQTLHDPEIGHTRHAVPVSRLLPPPHPRPEPPHIAADSGSQLNPLEGRSIELAHDARNLISALHLYCELLASPGVLAPGFGCYAEDLRRLADSGAGLIEALAAGRGGPSLRRASRDTREIDALPLSRRRLPAIENLASELDALQGPLQALAGPSVRLEVESMPCAGPLALNAEDLLRILFNLVANAVEALAGLPVELRRRPFLRISAQRGDAASFLAQPASRSNQLGGQTVLLSVRDNGPGIDVQHLPHIFEAGFSTRRKDEGQAPRGLGLAIVRRLVAAAGGGVRVVCPSGLGTRFDIELPVFPSEATAPYIELAGSR
jgi:signal transduction histidine kinase